MHRGRLLLTAALAAYGLYYLFVPGHFGVIDYVDLAVHETGHLAFGPFGEFLGYLGGTLLQLLFPVVFAWYFWRRGDPHAASVAGWWLAQNCWNVSLYVRDARSEELPLVGGGEHDWAYLLGETGLLEYDQVIADAIRVAGMLLFAWAALRGYTHAHATLAPRPPIQPG